MSNVVIGLGNALLTDEGVGVHLIEKLARRHALTSFAGYLEYPDNTQDSPTNFEFLKGSPTSQPEQEIEFIDLGTAGTRVLHAIAGKKKAIFLDCAYMNAVPGTIRKFTPEEVESQKTSEQISLHEGDLFRTLELSRRLGECPSEIVIFAIEPRIVAPGENLSPLLSTRMRVYLDLIEQELYAV